MALSKITTESLLDGEVTTAKLADDQITLAKMAGGTDGNIISYDASGNPVAIATGNDGQVLTSTGAGSPPAFEDAGGGGAWTLIATAVASNSASLTITGLDSTYDTYAVAFSDLVPASDSQTPQLRVGDSGGLDTGNSDYSHLRMGDRVDNASFNLTGSMHNAVDRLNLMSNGAGNAAGEGFGGMMFVHNPQDSTSRHTFTGQFTCMNYAGAFCYDTFGGQRNTVINLDRINFQFQAGNITSGRMTVWGIAHA